MSDTGTKPFLGGNEDKANSAAKTRKSINAYELAQLLHNVNQVLTGYSADDTWSEWDESVRQDVIKMQYKIEELKCR